MLSASLKAFSHSLCACVGKCHTPLLIFALEHSMKSWGKWQTFFLIRGSRNTELSQGNLLYILTELESFFNCHIYTNYFFVLVFSLSPHSSKVLPDLKREWLRGSSTNYCLYGEKYPLDVSAEKENERQGWKASQSFLGSPLSMLWESITKSA